MRKRARVSSETQEPAAQMTLQLLRDYWAGQPRASRIFTHDFKVLWDNTPDREHSYPVYQDSKGQIVSIPPLGKARELWPVQRALMERRTVERDYRVLSNPPSESLCFRVRAWPLPEEKARQPLIVEEIEKMETAVCVDGNLGELDVQLSHLILQVADFMVKESDPEFLYIRLKNPYLRPCYEIKQCHETACPAYKSKDNLRCWEISRTFCPQKMSPQYPLDKFLICSKCEVFLSACPDPLTRIGENVNRLLCLLQSKYKELMEAQQHVQQADKMAALGELISGIMHELKNPLSILMGRLDCLSLEMESLSVTELREDLNVIQSQGARIHHVLENLLRLARPLPTTLEAIHINEVVLETLTMVRKTLDEEQIRLTTELDPEVPLVFADSLQIEQVLLNLILNARDAMPQGGELTIASQRSAEKDDGVTLIISDTGQGISEEELPQIFSPFYTTKAAQSGTGLGLAVCQRIMRQHQGKIEVTSTLGSGTAFRLWFPTEEVTR